MTQYKCVKRLTTDGGKTVHEVGDTVELSGKDEEAALRARAVVPQKPQKPAKPDPPKGDA